MKPKNDLHQLIHALSGSEKRYFSLFAQRHVIGSKNKYIKLFYYIANQKEYNEEKLLQKLKAEYKQVNLAAEKIYLKELILKSLRQFHEKNFVDSILYDKVIQIRILYEKGLFKIGYELIEKTIALAEKHEKLLPLGELMIWKINYDIKLNQTELIPGNAVLANKKINQFLELIDYKKSYHELYSLASKTENIETQSQIKKVIQHLKTLVNKPIPRSKLAAHYYYSILSFIAVLENNTKKMLMYFEKDINIFKDNLSFCQEEPNFFLQSCNNYIYSLIISNELEVAEQEIDFLQLTSDKLKLSDQQKARAFINISDNKLLVFSKQNNPNAAYDAAKQIDKKLIIYEQYIETARRTDLYFSLANIYFFSNDYKACNRFLNKIIKSKTDKEADRSMVALAMVAQVTTMLQSTELTLFKNRMNTTRTYIKANKAPEWLLSFCDYLALHEKNVATGIKQNTKKQLANSLSLQATNDKVISKLISYFDLIKWMKRH